MFEKVKSFGFLLILLMALFYFIIVISLHWEALTVIVLFCKCEHLTCINKSLHAYLLISDAKFHPCIIVSYQNLEVKCFNFCTIHLNAFTNILEVQLSVKFFLGFTDKSIKVIVLLPVYCLTCANVVVIINLCWCLFVFFFSIPKCFLLQTLEGSPKTQFAAEES